MIGYHEPSENTMKIFPTQSKAKEHCGTDEMSVPYGSLYGEQHWIRMPKTEYIRFRYSVKFAH
jgi:hypothetical protein